MPCFNPIINDCKVNNLNLLSLRSKEFHMTSLVSYGSSQRRIISLLRSDLLLLFYENVLCCLKTLTWSPLTISVLFPSKRSTKHTKICLKMQSFRFQGFKGPLSSCAIYRYRKNYIVKRNLTWNWMFIIFNFSTWLSLLAGGGGGGGEWINGFFFDDRRGDQS